MCGDPHATDGIRALLVDAKVARAIVAMGSRRFWALTNIGAIPSRRIGRTLRYEPRELAAWVAAGCPTDPGAGERVRAGMAK